MKLSRERLFGHRVTPRVAIVGGGFSGIAMAVKLKRAGIETFAIFEHSTSLGGTWRDNHYPGAEVDTPASFYAYSFKKDYDWSRSYAPQSEILRYLEET